MSKQIRKALSAELSTGTLLYTSIFESCVDAIDFKTPDGVIAAWNPAAEQLYGYLANEIVGQHVSILYKTEDFEAFASRLEEAKVSLSKSHFTSIRLTKDGKNITVFMTLSPVVDRTGKLLGVSAISRDITGEMHMKKEAERLERDRSELLSVLANDVKNSINQISRMANTLILKRVDSRAQKDLESVLEALRRSNDEFDLTIDNLLTVYSLRTGDYLHFQKVQISEILGKIVDELEKLNPELRLIVKLPADNLQIKIDADQKLLSRLFLNVVEWAVIRSNKNETVEVNVQPLSPNSSVEVRVSYCGRTYDTREVESIFSSRWRESNGAETGSLSGLGLFLARWTAEAHAGSLELYSSAGRNTFIIALPTVQEQTTKRVDITR